VFEDKRGRPKIDKTENIKTLNKDYPELDQSINSMAPSSSLPFGSGTFCILLPYYSSIRMTGGTGKVVIRKEMSVGFIYQENQMKSFPFNTILTMLTI
jgi:hypothetical protein